MLNLLISSGCVAASMAWAIGAQDVSNALGTAVGSKAITVRQAIVLGAICEFSGSLLGGSVAHTISKGIVDPALVSTPQLYAHLMFFTLTGAFLWLAIATFLSLPVSTSHSLVGSLVGLAVWTCPDALNASILKVVIASWVTSPLVGGAIAFAIFSLINGKILKSARPMYTAMQVIPFLWGFTLSVLVMFLLISGPALIRMSPARTAGVGAAVFGVSVLLFKRRSESLVRVHPEDTPEKKPVIDSAARAESMFVSLMIVTASVVAFAHGSNDVSNSIGPFAAIVEVFIYGDAVGERAIPLWILICGGAGIVFGLATYGYKVMATVGERITKLTFSRGFTAQIATALTVLTASLVGLSVSTTHCLIGAIAGIALVEGTEKINTATLKKIVVSWVVTLPASAFFSLFVCQCYVIFFT